MVDQRIYLPGSELWLRQRQELEEWEEAWQEAHLEWGERMKLKTQAARRPMRTGRDPMWLHFTVLSFPTEMGPDGWRELLVGSHCPACRREWVRIDHIGVGQIEVVVQSGERPRATVDVTCRACLTEHEAQFTHL